MFNKLLLIAMLVASTQGFAGQDGNGGFGLNCNGRIEVLDLYEAKELNPYNVDLGPANASIDFKIEKMLKRLERVNKSLANRYREQYKNLWDFAIVLKGKNVINNTDVLIGKDIAYGVDVGETILPDNCKFTPLARNMYTDDLDFHIYFFAKYWDSLDNDNKAVLILHEMIYYDVTSGNLKFNGFAESANLYDSASVRKLVSVLTSTDAETMPLERFIQKIPKYMFIEIFNNQVHIARNNNLQVRGETIIQAEVILYTSYRSTNTIELKRGINKFHITGVPHVYKSVTKEVVVGNHSYSGYVSGPTVATYEDGKIKALYDFSIEGLKRIFSQTNIKGDKPSLMTSVQFNREGKIECLNFEPADPKTALLMSMLYRKRIKYVPPQVKIGRNWYPLYAQLRLDSNEVPVSTECKIDEVNLDY